jgi:hypothetical protein
MELLNKLIKEEIGLDNEILNNRVMQMRGLHRLIMNNNMSAPDRAELLDKIRDIEDRVEAQLNARNKSLNQRRLFTSNPNEIDADIRREMIRLKAERESFDRIKGMSLKNLMSSKIGKGSQKSHN